MGKEIPATVYSLLAVARWGPLLKRHTHRFQQSCPVLSKGLLL